MWLCSQVPVCCARKMQLLMNFPQNKSQAKLLPSPPDCMKVVVGLLWQIKNAPSLLPMGSKKPLANSPVLTACHCMSQDVTWVMLSCQAVHANMSSIRCTNKKVARHPGTLLAVSLLQGWSGCGQCQHKKAGGHSAPTQPSSIGHYHCHQH